MGAFFPPSGAQDKDRLHSLKDDEREYLLFSLEFCDAIIGRRPSHLEALELAATHCTELGYYADGLGLDQRLAALKPDDPGILYNLSCSLALLGRRAEALDTLEQAVRKGYADPRHLSSDRDLASLREEERFKTLVAAMTGTMGG